MTRGDRTSNRTLPPFNIIHQLRPPGALLRPTAPI